MNKIVLMTGPPGSGKTTIGREIAKHFPKSLHIPVDALREMMVNGLEVPSEGWNDKYDHQFKMARSAAIYMAKLYAEQDVFVVIDDVSVPGGFESHYTNLFEHPNVERIMLLPTQKKLIERMQRRAGPWEEVLIKLIPWFYSFLEPMSKEGWKVLDTGDWTIEQTTSAVLAHIG